MQPTTIRLSTRQAAEYLGIPEETLRWFRQAVGSRGRETLRPVSTRNVVYDLADLDAWARQRKAQETRRMRFSTDGTISRP